MEIPGDLRYTKDHLWLSQADRIVTCGITDHAQELLDEVTVVEFPEGDSEIDKEDIIVTIESLKSVLDIVSPFKGIVTEKNETLINEPGFVNTSPYKDGWIVKIKPEDPDVFSSFMTADQYKDFIDED